MTGTCGHIRALRALRGAGGCKRLTEGLVAGARSGCLRACLIGSGSSHSLPGSNLPGRGGAMSGVFWGHPGGCVLVWGEQAERVGAGEGWELRPDRHRPRGPLGGLRLLLNEMGAHGEL